MTVPPSDWTIDYFLANESDCLRILKNSDALKAIPSLNSLSLDNFRNGQLVHFQGMLQDMYNPEFYLKNYQVVDKNTGQNSSRNGMYLDGARCESHEEVLVDSEKNESDERQSWVVISIPGLNDWVKQDRMSVLTKNETCSPSSTSHETNKRSLNDTEEPMDCSEPVTKREKVSTDESNTGSSQSKETSKSRIVSKDHILNFPIPSEDGKACIVKVYKEFPCKINQVIDIIGFISLDPNLSAIYDSQEMDDLETQTHHPPTSLVPRLHAVQIVKEAEKNNPESNLLLKAAQIRGDLKTLLRQLLFGDDVAADYLICHLISSVYLRNDCLCLGAFALNITNFPKEHENFVKDFYEILQSIISKTHLIDLTLDNLNNMNFVPKKDYDCNRLTSGILQLSKNTHLILDETKLTAGQITSFGRQNYAAVSDLIQFQKLAYDFKFYTVEFETDIPILILSETKSFIPCQMQIPLRPDPDTVRLYPQVVEAAKQFMKEGGRLSAMRQYIKTLKNSTFEFSDEVTEVIQEDFVKLRQANDKFSADDLHSLMVLSRLISLSYGMRSLNTKIWKECLAMESERLSRLPLKRN